MFRLFWVFGGILLAAAPALAIDCPEGSIAIHNSERQGRVTFDSCAAPSHSEAPTIDRFPNPCPQGQAVQHEFNRNGSLREYCAGADGRPVGLFLEFYPNHKLATRGNFDAQGRQQGTFTHYYDDGSLKGTNVFRDGKREGREVAFYPNGAIRLDVPYHNDLADGPAREFYENGRLKESASFVRDKKQGPFTAYYPNGQARERGRYVGGKKDGPNVRYYDNGRRAAQGTFHAGKQVGHWIYYAEHSHCKSREGNLNRDGQLEGVWTRFDETSCEPIAYKSCHEDLCLPISATDAQRRLASGDAQGPTVDDQNRDVRPVGPVAPSAPAAAPSAGAGGAAQAR